MARYCPVCTEEVTNSSGNSDCDYLIIEEFPELVLPPPSANGWQRQKEEWTPRKILVNELAKIGLVIQQFYILSAFPHHQPNNGTPNEQCYDLGLEQVRSAMEGRRGIIILGGNLCKQMTGYELKQVQGLSGVDFLLGWDAGDMPRVFLPTIRSIFSTGAGEFGLGLKRFANQIGVE